MTRRLLLIAVVALLLAADWHWHEAIWHNLLFAWYKVTGANDEGGPVYGSWSGFCGATGAISAPFIAVAFYYHHTCHYSIWCFRWGHVPLAGGLGKVCHRHHPHPDLWGQKRPRGKRLHELHERWLAEQQGKGAP